MSTNSQKKLLAQFSPPFIESIIHTTRDLAYLLRAMPADLSLSLLDDFTPDFISRLIDGEQSLQPWKNLLEEKEYEYLIQKIRVHA